MSLLKKLFTSFVLALAFSAPAFAIDYYIVDCQPGADLACIAGDDTRTATQAQNPETPWRTWAGVPAINKQGNTRFLFGRGGYLTNVKIGLGWLTGTKSRTTELTPVAFDAYTPSWCVGSCTNTKPVLEQSTSNQNLFESNTGGSRLADGGYIFRNLKLVGGGSTSYPAVTKGQVGIFLYDVVRGVIIENMDISGFASAIQPANNNNLYTYNLVVRNSYIHHNTGASVLGGANGLLIENNLFEYNGDPDAIPDSHDMYLSYVNNGVVRNNIFRNTTFTQTSKCGKTVFVVHGKVDGLLIEGNRFEQPGGIGTCYGIEVDNGYLTAEHMKNVVIRDNLVVDVGGVGIVVGVCQNCVIESNSIVWTSVSSQCFIGISTYGGNAPKPIDTPNQQISIRNNSVYMNCNGNGTIQGMTIKNAGNQHSVTNNITYFGPNTSTRTSRTCINWDTNTPANFLATGKNICYYSGGTPTWSNLHSTLGAAQAAGWDAGSLNVDPLFVATPAAGNDYSLAVQAGSPAVNAGHATYKSRLSAGRKFPIDQRDIGAHDFGAVLIAPVAPISFR